LVGAIALNGHRPGSVSRRRASRLRPVARSVPIYFSTHANSSSCHKRLDCGENQ
jgi:hypothetical protein